jgi:hypothetical protein
LRDAMIKELTDALAATPRIAGTCTRRDGVVSH